MSRGIMLVLTLTGSAVIFLCQGSHSRCTNTTKSRNTGGSCSFEYNHCGWTEVNDHADDVSWERLDNFHYGQNSYIRVNFDGASAGSVARLHSPWLCATGSDAFRSLTFRYSIEKSDLCRLSVFVVTKTHRKQVWETSQGTGVSFSQPVASIYLQCSHEPFQIVFVGQKLTSQSCGKLFHGDICLDDIIFRDVFVTSTPHHDCDKFPPGVFTTALPPLPPTDGTVTHSIRNESNVNIGALVGVLLVVFIVVIAAVVAYLVWRRKKKQRLQIDQELSTKTRAMTNCTYMAGTDSLIPAVPHTNRSADVTSPIDVREEDGDVAYSAGNAAIYSVPNDLDPDPTMTPSPEDRVNSARPPVPEFTGLQSVTPTPLSRDSGCASRYNRLQRHGGGRHLGQEITGEHTYNHLGERDEDSRYEPLARVDNCSEESRGAEGREPRAVSSSTMVSDYVDMNQMRGQTSGDLSDGAVYENCD